MEYNQIKEMLPDYVRGLLNEEESLAVKGELEKSESLRKEYEELCSYYNALKTLEPVTASDNFLDTVHKRLVIPPLFTRISKNLFHPLHIKIPIELAGLAVTVMIVVLIYNPFSSKNIPPVVFDESSMQAKKAPIDERIVEEVEEEKIEEIVTPKPIEKKIQESAKEKPRIPSSTIQRQKPKSLVTATTGYQKDYEMRKRAQQSIKKKEASGQYAHKIEPEAPPAETEQLAYADRAPSTSAVSGAAMDEDELYAAEVIERSDSIVLQTRQIKPEVDDVGLLALSISQRDVSLDKSISASESALRKLEESETKKRSTAAKRARLYRKKETPAVQAQPQKNEIIFAQIEKNIKTHNGKCTLLKNKPQTEYKRYYVIEIPREDFPTLKKTLESEGEVSDEKFSIETSEAELIQFNLIINIE